MLMKNKVVIQMRHCWGSGTLAVSPFQTRREKCRLGTPLASSSECYNKFRRNAIRPHRSGLYARWALDIRRAEFFHAGQRVGVAVSGRPDSVLLLRFMSRLRRDLGLTITAIHF